MRTALSGVMAVSGPGWRHTACLEHSLHDFFSPCTRVYFVEETSQMLYSLIRVGAGDLASKVESLNWEYW